LIKPLWVVLALSAAAFVAGAAGWLAKAAGHLNLAEPLTCLLLAGMALLPLTLAALSLERGRPAPAWRSWAAPWALAALAYLAVQLSGALTSPLMGIYVLVGFLWARQAPWGVALGVAALLTLFEALPLVTVGAELTPPFWPAGLNLIWPSAGVLAGWLSRGTVLRQPAAPKVVSSSGSAPWPVAALPDEAAATDAAALLHADLQASLDLAFASHPGWNALALWWWEQDSVRLRHLNMRLGTPAPLGTELVNGEGLLSLALREQRPLNLEPLAGTAGRSLTYYSEPGPARVLRALPLSDEGRQIGLLACDKADETPFSLDEVKALEALARGLVGHAQRAGHLARHQEAGNRTNKLYEATKALGSSLDQEDLLNRFGALLAGVVPVDSWALGWRDEEHGDFRRLASAGYAAGAGEHLPVQQNAALAGLLQQADASVVFNGESSAVPAALNEGLAKPANHFLLVPLRVNGRLKGLLKLDRRLAPFEEDERESASIFGSQAAITLENAHFYSLNKRLATTDGLTGLYNHRYFQERLALELQKAERTGHPLSLALTDIDFFKKFNDSFGHQEGDAVLRKVAVMLKDLVRPGQDIVCRYGGEEFVVIMPQCDIVEARQVMDQLRAHCAAHLTGGNDTETRAITLSIGLCTYPQGAKEQRELIHSADEALYKAKEQGRNKVCSYKD
jgi:diguanylate cyclase (GGDEF)-like protein